LVEVCNEWTFNQPYECIVFESLKSHNPKQRMNSASKLKENEDKMGTQHKINSTQYKTLLRDMKNGMVMISFNYCFEDDTYLLHFIAN
jgi:hypothetical protein